MDIKLKNIEVRIILKTIMLIIAIISGVLTFYSFEYKDVYYSELKETSYYNTRNFVAHFANLTHNVVELNTILINADNIKNNFPEDRVEYNLNRFNNIKFKLSNNKNMVYKIIDTTTGQEIDGNTNLSTKDIRALNNYVIFSSKDGAIYHYGTPGNVNDYSSNNYEFFNDVGTEILRMFVNTEYKVYAGIKNELEPGDKFYNDYKVFDKFHSKGQTIETLLGVSLLLLITALSYLVLTSGKVSTHKGIQLCFIDKIYNDIQLAAVPIFMSFIFNVVLSIGREQLYDRMFGEITVSTAFYWMIASTAVSAGISLVLSFSRQFKARKLWKNTVIYHSFMWFKKAVKYFFTGKTIKLTMIYCVLLFSSINIFVGGVVVFVLATSHNIILAILSIIILFATVNGCTIFLLWKYMVSVQEIMKATKEISEGNLDYHLSESVISVPFNGFANNLMDIRSGMKKAVNEAVKGEKMKTELITNVSHDLKTPLTSIISYIDLLIKENCQNENIVNYAQVIEEKSYRLKQLIEDLIEASKVSSGNIQLSMEKINLNEMVSQANGEYEERMAEKHLDVRIETGLDSTYILADGTALWRVISNLFENVAKYAAPYTRVYINLFESEGKGCLVIKNISEQPLEIEPERLSERFVRGDSSRSTEGSGLGLSIASSLTEAQEGVFMIDIDGDLFKVTICMELWAE